MNFEGGVHALEGAYTVTGLTTVNGGTVDVVADVTLPKATISSGIVEGAGTLRFTGPFTWSGGTMRGLGKTIVEENATATLPALLTRISAVIWTTAV